MDSSALFLIVLTVAMKILDRQDIHYELGSRKNWDKEYDFIVIGAGCGGSIVASRLTEVSRKYKVLLLEAGGPDTVVTDIPEAYATPFSTDMNWNFTTVEQKNVHNKTFDYIQGRVLGGSTTLNGM